MGARRKEDSGAKGEEIAPRETGLAVTVGLRPLAPVPEVTYLILARASPLVQVGKESNPLSDSTDADSGSPSNTPKVCRRGRAVNGLDSVRRRVGSARAGVAGFHKTSAVKPPPKQLRRLNVPPAVKTAPSRGAGRID
jgi:hypothetical protein